MECKLDMLKIVEQKSITKEFSPGQSILMSCAIFKFNDYKKKQERNIVITNRAVYNLKGQKGALINSLTIKRKIDIDKIYGISISRICGQFVLHVPSEYDYRYAAIEKKDLIIYNILKAYNQVCHKKMPIYYRDELSLVHLALTKQERRKNNGPKQIEGQFTLHDEKSYEQYLQKQGEEKERTRKGTKTLFSKNQVENVDITDFTPKVILGKGAFGVVYLVEKNNSKEIYAMKEIRKQDIVKKNQLEHTRAEKMILEHINHPFLVNLAYAFQTPSNLYFIMNFMKGGQLFQHLSNAKKFSQKQTKFYSMQIAMGLGHLHQKNYIYRDLKLENVLMDEKGNISLTDFGMAKLLNEDELAKTFCGTPEYLAPQVLAGRGYNKAADWWSLGILTFEMLYGLPPFYHTSQATMFKMITQSEVRFSEKVQTSTQCKDFIIKILNKKPEQRLGSKNDMEQILSHPWFKDMDRKKMLNKQIETPFKPDVVEWEKNFDPDFINQRIQQNRQEIKQDRYKNLFKDF